MRKIFSFIMAGCMTVCAFTSCMDDTDEPNTEDLLITSPVSVGEVNSSIAELKSMYKSLFTQSNAFEQVQEDIVIEAVVAANDISGNLYQTLLLRDINEEEGTDQGIVLGVKNTCLYPYFMLGQRVKVNLKGLYIGVYSKLPKIGQPYYTSSGNLRLGPMLLQLCGTQVELVGKPDPSCAECQPKVLDEAWLKASDKNNYLNYPMLVTIKGNLAEADGTAIFAPEAEQDAGYGVDRTLKVGSTNVTLRTSTQNDIAFLVMPQNERSYTGLLSYYSSWQIQLRSVDDIYPSVEEYYQY